MFALPKLEAMLGISRAEAIEMIKNVDAESVEHTGDRRRIEAIQAFGELDDLAAAYGELEQYDSPAGSREDAQ